jgi:hypothetical protein
VGSRSEVRRCGPLSPDRRWRLLPGAGTAPGGALTCRAEVERGSYEPQAFAEIVAIAATVLAGLALLAYLVVTG